MAPDPLRSSGLSHCFCPFSSLGRQGRSGPGGVGTGRKERWPELMEKLKVLQPVLGSPSPPLCSGDVCFSLVSIVVSLSLLILILPTLHVPV